LKSTWGSEKGLNTLLDQGVFRKTIVYAKGKCKGGRGRESECRTSKGIGADTSNLKVIRSQKRNPRSTGRKDPGGGPKRF